MEDHTSLPKPDEDTVATLPPEPYPDTEHSDPPTKHRSNTTRRRSKNAKLLAEVRRNARNLKITLIVVLLASVLVILAGKRTITQLRADKTQIQTQMEELEQQARNDQTKLKDLLAEMQALIEKRLPGIRPLEFDHVIQLGQDYVKNIVLTTSQQHGETVYEYRLVLLNPRITPVLPNVRIYLFDQSGVQAGLTDVALEGTTAERRLRALAPGEIRAYTGTISTIRQRTPVYFWLEVE